MSPQNIWLRAPWKNVASLNNQVLDDSIFNKLRPRNNVKFFPKGVNAGPFCADIQKFPEQVWPRYDTRSGLDNIARSYLN